MKPIDTNKEIKSFSLEHLKKAWSSLQIEGDWSGCWKKEMEGMPMNKKNIINELLEDDVFKAESMGMFTDEKDGSYHGFSLGVHVTTEDSVLAYLRSI